MENMAVVMMGDFNCDCLRPSSQAGKLLSLMSEYSFVQMVDGPTRVTQGSASQIDLLFCMDTDLLRSVGCVDPGLSDHCLIFGELDAKNEQHKQTVRMIKCFRKCDWEKLLKDLELAPWQVMDSMEDIDSQWDYWKKLFEEIVASHIPTKKVRVRRKTLPWITPGIRALMRARSYYLTKAKRSGQIEDWKEFRRVRNQVTASLRAARREHFENLCTQSAGNPGKVWKELSRLVGKGQRKSVESLKGQNGVIMDKHNIADEFGAYFSSVVGSVDVGSSDACAKLPWCESAFRFDAIDEEDVLKLLEGLDPNKAVGVDGISGKILRAVAPGVSASLTSLFNASIRSGQIPREWKSAHVTPVFKSGDSELVGNYRPVSVLPVVVKLFEKLVHGQLYRYLQEHRILNPLQFGFRPGHTTQDVLVSMTDEWRKAIDEDKLVGSVMLDLSKAFDSVDHSILLQKLERYGVRGDELEWFKGYLYGRRQRVCVGEEKSAWSDVRRGVPQGSILGPLLFILSV